MAQTIKVLGQSAPSATTETALYTVSASTEAVVSTLYVCNRSSAPATFRVSVSVGGGATSNEDYLYYDVTIQGNDSLRDTVGMSLAATDVVRVYASTANLSFTLFGNEIT